MPSESANNREIGKWYAMVGLNAVIDWRGELVGQPLSWTDRERFIREHNNVVDAIRALPTQEPKK